MTYYSIQNPLGSILHFVNSYNLSDSSERRENILKWQSDQSPALDIEKHNAIYDEFSELLNLDIELLDELFKSLSWMTIYIKPLLEEKISIAFKSGLIENKDGKVILTEIGKYLFEANEYNNYVNSIHYKANFWKRNNLKITDDINIGSGFFIDLNTIVTCKHVYEELIKEKIYIEDEGGRKYTVTEVTPHPSDKIDIIKLTTEESFDFFPHTTEDNIILTERVIVFGYPPIPLSSKPFLMANLGEVSSIVDNYLDGTDCIILSCILRPGNSGGPIINEYGKLIGISTQNRSQKVTLTWNDTEDLDLNKSLGYATGLNAKYINEF
ncbi:trypsin-like peptidase domain-containing protein [Flavobacterium sp. ANB]|uniref:S1 family peptidase n=1 Tax=unclassified Flavobacterium TaxID=196869 RepID=UPI0012B81A1E|nr:MULTISPECIES: serine protease [unclassified Flavobacterium]MBF4517817.1 trypsin-like peptidase domain-containing protein [Flavobacterium sp. ANB]MTD70544.1 hypothetical protein [Flavobacterium sp. LC2016-13]